MCYGLLVRKLGVKARVQLDVTLVAQADTGAESDRIAGSQVEEQTNVRQ